MPGPLICILLLLGLEIEFNTQAEHKNALNGVWQSVAITRNGEKIVDVALLNMRTLTIKNENYILKVEGMTIEGKLRIDKTTNPNSLNFTPSSGKYADQTILGIYEVTGTTMKICAAPPGLARPTEFVSKAGTKHDLFVYEKLKPAK